MFCLKKIKSAVIFLLRFINLSFQFTTVLILFKPPFFTSINTISSVVDLQISKDQLTSYQAQSLLGHLNQWLLELQF